MSGRIKLVALDLDGTLWDCEDVSLLTPPFRSIGEGVAVDSEGRLVRVREGVKEFLKWCRSKGLLLATLSWNDPAKALAALKALDLDKYFHYHAIEYHPRKHEMLAKLLTKLREEGMGIRPEEVIYVDDRNLHLKDIRERVGAVKFVRFGRDVKDFRKLRDLLEELMAPTKNMNSSKSR